jgi:glycerol-3-phosphate dehydrogenase (NAD(P)+)
MSERFAIVGAGGWGTAVGLVLLEAGHEVVLLGRDEEAMARMAATRENARYLPGVRLPDELRLTADAAAALSGADTVVNAVPTQWIRDVFTPLSGHIARGTRILSLSKGIEIRTLMRPSKVLQEVVRGCPVAVLSGPSHAEEVARRCPASVVIASKRGQLARKLQAALSTRRFRVYTNRDPVGVELAGALKNVIAIAAGIVDGLGFGDNTKAALLTRGLVEITRLAKKLGGRAATFTGLAGIGDLMTTSFSRHGRNRAVGERIGRGEPLESILAGMKMVAEGVPTTRAAVGLAKKHRVELPIVQEVHAILFENKPPLEALGSLMTRSVKGEREA